MTSELLCQSPRTLGIFEVAIKLKLNFPSFRSSWDFQNANTVLTYLNLTFVPMCSNYGFLIQHLYHATLPTYIIYRSFIEKMQYNYNVSHLESFSVSVLNNIMGHAWHMTNLSPLLTEIRFPVGWKNVTF